MEENLEKYEARDIAKFFIECAESEGRNDMSPLKIQKLVYFAHGMYLAMTGGKPLIEEDVYAWIYGPVIKPLYRELKIWGSKTVQSDFFDDAKKVSENKEIADFLKNIWELLKKYTAVQLSMMTHEKNGPWDKVFIENHGSNEGKIENKDMMVYFSKFFK